MSDVSYLALTHAFEVMEGDFSQREIDFASVVIRAIYENQITINSLHGSLSSALTASRFASRMADIAEHHAQTSRAISDTALNLSETVRAETYGGYIEEFTDPDDDGPANGDVEA